MLSKDKRTFPEESDFLLAKDQPNNLTKAAHQKVWYIESVKKTNYKTKQKPLKPKQLFTRLCMHAFNFFLLPPFILQPLRCF